MRAHAETRAPLGRQRIACRAAPCSIPTGAMENPEPVVAKFDPSACRAFARVHCHRCLDACPLGDRGILSTVDGPAIQPDCDGCGLCVVACADANGEAALRLVRVSKTRYSLH